MQDRDERAKTYTHRRHTHAHIQDTTHTRHTTHTYTTNALARYTHKHTKHMQNARTQRRICKRHNARTRHTSTYKTHTRDTQAHTKHTHETHKRIQNTHTREIWELRCVTGDSVVRHQIKADQDWILRFHTRTGCCVISTL